MLCVQPEDGSCAMGSDYENDRNKRIAANRERLAMLGLTAAKAALQDACHTPKQAAKPRAPKSDWAMVLPLITLHQCCRNHNAPGAV